METKADADLRSDFEFYARILKDPLIEEKVREVLNPGVELKKGIIHDAYSVYKECVVKVQFFSKAMEDPNIAGSIYKGINCLNSGFYVMPFDERFGDKIVRTVKEMGNLAADSHVSEERQYGILPDLIMTYHRYRDFKRYFLEVLSERAGGPDCALRALKASNPQDFEISHYGFERMLYPLKSARK